MVGIKCKEKLKFDYLIMLSSTDTYMDIDSSTPIIMWENDTIQCNDSCRCLIPDTPLIKRVGAIEITCND